MTWRPTRERPWSNVIPACDAYSSCLTSGGVPIFAGCARMRFPSAIFPTLRSGSCSNRSSGAPRGRGGADFPTAAESCWRRIRNGRRRVVFTQLGDEPADR